MIKLSLILIFTRPSIFHSSKNEMKKLWLFLHKTEPTMQKVLEIILENSFQEVRRAKTEIEAMETALNR